ncbi:MAG TPA: NAD-binding protein [Verrucomicrobiae bacterium]|nr:NAD-binding protein [Verrucomicrobiae bacterium]
MAAQRIIILGAGRFGTYLGSKLSEYGCDVLLADHDSNRVKELAEDGFHVLEADVEDEDALKELGVAEADAVVVCIGENMQGSILATLALKELKAKKSLPAPRTQNMRRSSKKSAPTWLFCPRATWPIA